MTRIAFVGAGSVVFTKNLLGDILELPELREVEIALHDIDADRLDDRRGDGRAVAASARRAPAISTHLDRRAALDGADYVLNMVQIGGHEATLRDFEIPARYGLRQTIADTLGVGGIFRTLRTADHMLALGREMAELCPARPGSSTTRTRWRCSAGSSTRARRPAKVVGLCHSVQFTIEDLSELVGVPAERGDVPRRRPQPPGVHPPLRARRRESLPAPRRADRRRPGAAAPRARRALPPARLLPDRVERARRRVRAVVHAATTTSSSASGSRSTSTSAAARRTSTSSSASRTRSRAARRSPVERSNEYAAVIVHSMETGEPAVIYGNVRNDGLLAGPAGRHAASRCRASSTAPGSTRSPCPTTRRSSPP